VGKRALQGVLPERKRRREHCSDDRLGGKVATF